MHKKRAASVLFASFLLLHPSHAFAQDTFGPICDGITVTCPPTPPVDTPVPQPTTPAAEPPRSGHMETVLLFLGLSGMCIAAGVFLRRSYIEA